MRESIFLMSRVFSRRVIGTPSVSFSDLSGPGPAAGTSAGGRRWLGLRAEARRGRESSGTTQGPGLGLDTPGQVSASAPSLYPLLDRQSLGLNALCSGSSLFAFVFGSESLNSLLFRKRPSFIQIKILFCSKTVLWLTEGRKLQYSNMTFTVSVFTVLKFLWTPWIWLKQNSSAKPSPFPPISSSDLWQWHACHCIDVASVTSMLMVASSLQGKLFL